MKAYILVSVILSIFAVGDRIGREFAPITYDKNVQIWSSIISIIFIIWGLNLIID